MNNAVMIIMHPENTGRRVIQHNVCPSRNCAVKGKNVPIHRFHSPVHAVENGWVYTKGDMFCPPGEKAKGVWVCPECAKKVKWVAMSCHRKAWGE